MVKGRRAVASRRRKGEGPSGTPAPSAVEALLDSENSDLYRVQPTLELPPSAERRGSHSLAVEAEQILHGHVHRVASALSRYFASHGSPRGILPDMPFTAKRFRVGQKDLETLRQWIRCPTMPQQWALRAHIVLGSAEGEGVRELARRLGVRAGTVSKWRLRYIASGLAGLQTLPRSGRPRKISEARERAIVAKTLSAPKAVTHWSCRRLAREVGASSATVHRIWGKYDLQPHRTSTFKFSSNLAFERKLADIVGLYLDPPEKALVLCVDEKSQIQALDRTQPILLMAPGLPARMTHDYRRHGTTSLFAALEVASGKVLGRCFPRHTHEEFLSFLEAIEKKDPRREVHVICDNYGTHKHPRVRAWFSDNPRFHLHFTPTSASWLNLVERWFALITAEAIRRGSHHSVRALERAINQYLDGWNEDATPFQWRKPAAAIRRSSRRVARIYGAAH